MDNRSKEQIVAAICAMSREDFRQVMFTIAENNPYPEEAVAIYNKWHRFIKKDKKKNASNWGSQTDKSVELFQQGAPTPKRVGRDGKASRAVESSPTACLVPDVHGISAWKVPVVFRGDLVPKHGKLFIDVEKLSMKTSWNGGHPAAGKSKHRQLANNVAVVDEKGTLILWAFIYRDPDQICQYFTKLHRISKSKVMTGVTIDVVRPLLEKCFEGNCVVGANLINDFASLTREDEFLKNRKFLPQCDTVDILSFYQDSSNNAINLKDLVAHFFPEKDRFQTDFHSCIADARLTMHLYLKMRELQSDGYNDTSSIQIQRSKKKPYVPSRDDKCKCTK